MESEVLVDLYRHARLLPVVEFHRYALQLIRPILRFQSANWGVGYFEGASIQSTLVPVTMHTLEIDPMSISEWRGINRADKVIPIAMAANHATCNFHAPTLFSGKNDRVMSHFARRFGRQCYLGTVMRGKPGSTVEWLSVYRPDPDDHFSERERTQCQWLAKHLSEASRINQLVQYVDPDVLKMLDDQNSFSVPLENTDKVSRTGPAQPVISFVEKYLITRSEWKVALRLMDGGTAAQIAESLNLSVATIRSHIRALLAKTGTTRQAQLVAKLMSEGSK